MNVNEVEYFEVTPAQSDTSTQNCHCFKQGNVVKIQGYNSYRVGVANAGVFCKVPIECAPRNPVSYIPCGVAYLSSTPDYTNPKLTPCYAGVLTDGTVFLVNDFALPMYGASVNFSYII